MDIEFQNGDCDKALQRLDLIRELEAKPANKLSTGNLLTSVIEARKINLPSEQAYPSMSDYLSRSLFNQYN